MIETIKGLLKQLFTGKDNETHDLGRYSWAASMASVIGGGAWNAIQSGAIDLMQLAQAIGVVAGVHGAVLWAKKDTEPDKKPEA